MTPRELLNLRNEFLLTRRKQPTEARMNPVDIVDLHDALAWGSLPSRFLYGMRIIPDTEQKPCEVLITCSKVVS